MRMMKDLSSILEKIKNLRVQKDLSQTQMAKFLGITQAGYANIENNDKAKLSLAYAVGIAEVLGVSFNELFDIAGDSSKVEELQNENESLKKRILELEEQLNDKRQIIQFLSNNNFLKEVAWIIKQREYRKEHPRDIFSDDDLSDEGLDREKFMKDEAEEYLKKYVEDGKNPPKGINEVS